MAPRSQSKSAVIASKLRADIVAGRLQPGACLPTWDNLVTEFDAARPTLTRAMAELKEDGFIRATRSKGTFVHDRPPHLTRFGLVFPSHPSIAYTGLGRWNRFWEVLSMMAPIVGEELDLEMPVYYNIGAGLGTDTDRLAQDLERERLGGVVVVSADTVRHPLIRGTSIPKVVVHSEDEDLGHPGVYVDRRDFVARSIAIMQEQGRRRIAVLTDRFFAFRLAQHTVVRTGTEAISWQDVSLDFQALMSEHGFESPPYWHLMLTPSAARNTVRLLFGQPEGERPDGLIICDDNLTEESLAGLVAANAVSPENLTVVSHSNWPAPTHPMVPTIGLGYDIRDLLRTCVSLLQGAQAGESAPAMTLMPARLRSEVDSPAVHIPARI